jgi:AcrR family transcriptional regulator
VRAGKTLAQPALARQAPAQPAPARQAPAARRQRSSLGGGVPAQQRVLGAQGRKTVRRLLDAGLAEFGARGLLAVTVDDVVRRAQTSHGTFYLYFSNKEDLFKALMRDALREMTILTDDFPVVTRDAAGRAALRGWLERFCGIYSAHAAVFRVLSQAEIVGEEVWRDGLQTLFRLAESMTTGMTAARRQVPAGAGQAGELTALACLMMLERVNYLMSVGVRLPTEEMADRLSAIIYAAFGE